MYEKIYEQFLRCRKVTTDSRKIEAGSIYFALKGEKFNGNAFALAALDAGASMAVVDEPQDKDDARVVLVSDGLTALQQVARMYRESFSIPFLAITGSNGKTTTKELIRDVLAKKYKVSATKGNLNNHIGVPLTLLSIPADCEFAVIEMGANHRGEIAGYCQYAKPDYALITNMGKAHLEGFGGEEGVVLGKRELYDFVNAGGGSLFVNTELEKLRKSSEGMRIIPYGFHTGAFQIECVSESPVLTYSYRSDNHAATYTTHLAGAYNLYNIASAIVVGRYFGVAEHDIHDAIQSYIPDNNRSQLTRTEKNLLILDAYNANPTSLEFALIGLSRQDNRNRFFVIGDMLELGEAAPEEHRHILQVAKDLQLNGIVVGEQFGKVCGDYAFDWFPDNVHAREYLEKKNLRDHTILIKGSRGIRLEEVVPAL
jgi:UDP-N-acetylmuramoyl-tripeptide--D-alanyl-D-alanine ligase